MKFYRIEITDDSDGHKGFAWFTAKKQALAEMKTWEQAGCGTDMVQVEIRPTKSSLLLALARFASHPDNG